MVRLYYLNSLAHFYSLVDNIEVAKKCLQDGLEIYENNKNTEGLENYFIENMIQYSSICISEGNTLIAAKQLESVMSLFVDLDEFKENKPSLHRNYLFQMGKLEKTRGNYFDAYKLINKAHNLLRNFDDLSLSFRIDCLELKFLLFYFSNANFF